MATSTPIEIKPELARLGGRLQALRAERGWTLEELAARTGLSAPYLSRVEAGERQPSLAALLTIGRVYGVGLAALFEEPPAAPRVVVRAGEVHARRGNGLLYAPLSADRRSAGLHPLRVVVPTGREGDELYAHDGEEWLYVLSGRLRLTLGDEQHVLGPGDAAHFVAATPHRLAAEGGEDVEAILVACAGARPQLLSSYL